MKYPLSYRRVDWEGDDGALTVRKAKNGGGVGEEVALKVRRPGDGSQSREAAEFGPGVEEIPEGSAIDDGVVDGASEEDGAVAKLGELEGGEGEEMAVVADGGV